MLLVTIIVVSLQIQTKSFVGVRLTCLHLLFTGSNAFLQGGGGVGGYPAEILGSPSSILQITAGDYFSCVLSGNFTVHWYVFFTFAYPMHSWGYGADGRLGNNNGTNYSTPQQILSLTNITKIWSGASHSLALAANGT